MKSSNYLMEFLYQVDILISEINKLNSKTRLYQKNAKNFDINFNVRFSISPDNFLRLRDFLQQKIEEGNCYNREIVNLKRNFFKEFSYITIKIEQEIARIEDVQEKEMNKIVYKAIYVARYENEINLRNSYNVENSIFDKFLGIAKFRKLMIENHQLKANLVKKEYEYEKRNRKNIFELVNMLENAKVKNGNVLCLQDDMIKAFMVDRNVIKRIASNSWRQAVLVPHGFFEKRAYYKVLNKNVIKENEELKLELSDNRIEKIKEKNLTKENLVRLNSKLGKILSGGITARI